MTRCWDHAPTTRPSFDEIFVELERLRYGLLPDVDAAVIDEYVAEILDFEREHPIARALA
jgi:hypothetical protein